MRDYLTVRSVRDDILKAIGELNASVLRLNDSHRKAGQLEERARILSRLASRLSTTDDPASEQSLKVYLDIMRLLTSEE